jgi:hypothetical protein
MIVSGAPGGGTSGVPLTITIAVIAARQYTHRGALCEEYV